MILGDLTEEKDRHSAQLVNEIVDELNAIAKCVPILILMGNHDYLNEGSPFFAFLSRIPRIHFITKLSACDDLPAEFRSIFKGDLFLPHTRNYKRDWDRVMPFIRGYRTIYAHQTFNNADVGWGRKLEGIPLETFPKTCSVVSGDIHVPQKLGPLTYIGAPYLVNFGDDYEPRLLEISDGVLRSVSVSGWPQKRLIEVDDVDGFKKAKSNPGDIVKIRLAVDKMTDWPAIREAAVKWANNHELEVYRIEPIVVKGAVNKRHRVKAQGNTDAAIVEAFGKRHTLTAETLKTGLDLIK